VCGNPCKCLSAVLTLSHAWCVQRGAAESVLKQLQAHQDAWQRVDVILEQSQNQQTKFLAMQVSLLSMQRDF
jgi:diaminopimelate epimerase